MEEISCECNITALSHSPNQCQKTGSIQLYERDSQQLWLCGDCYLTSDKLLSRNGSAEAAMSALGQLNIIKENA